MSELQKICERGLVVLASGGPLLRVICDEGNNTLCEQVESKTQHLFKSTMLRRMEKYEPRKMT